MASLCLLSIGCKTPLGMSRWKPNIAMPWSKKESQEDYASIDNVSGPLQRVMQAANWSKGRSDEHLQPAPAEAIDAYDKAEALFKQQEYKQAEKDLKKIAKRYRNTAIHEDAQFLVAECQFHQQRYSWAQDSYDQLLKDYPSSRYLDRSVKRLFAIAQTWLQSPEFVTTDEIQQVDLEQPAAKPKMEKPDLPHKIPIAPNLFDRTRPVFDTQGRALQALRSIWQNDPTGPLADDALMLAASHNLRRGNYLEADFLFGILREEYPKSPHLETAFVLGSHVKLMSYQGAAYDGKQLAAAEELKSSTLKLYPNSADSERLRSELAKIAEAKAQRDWEKVEYYRRKNNQKAMLIYCRLIIEDHPGTSYAARAQEKLQELGVQRSADNPADGIGLPKIQRDAPAAGAEPLPEEPRKLLPEISEDSLPEERPDPLETNDTPPGRVRLF